MDAARHTSTIKAIIEEMGFPASGIAELKPSQHADYLKHWIETGQAGTMSYLARHSHLRIDPRGIMPDARFAIILAWPYDGLVRKPPTDAADTDTSDELSCPGKVARYAIGPDYHVTLRQKLHELAGRIHAAIPAAHRTRVCVDTAPILERELAQQAGVGWVGKNTMVLNQQLGSFFFLGEIITTLDLVPDEPAVDRCGTCRRCIDACPTHALTSPYHMDASRCISYLTIEHRGDIPEHLQPLMGCWIFGCDQCQNVCPYNRQFEQSKGIADSPLGRLGSLENIEHLSEQEHADLTADSAMNRATLEMIQRNARIAKQNLERHQADNQSGA